MTIVKVSEVKNFDDAIALALKESGIRADTTFNSDDECISSMNKVVGRAHKIWAMAAPLIH